MINSHIIAFIAYDCLFEQLGEVARRYGEFTARGVKVIALSVDSVEHHVGWIKDIEASQGVEVRDTYVGGSV